MVKFTRKRRITLILGVLFAVALIAFQGYRWKLKRDLNQYRAELMAKGEKLSLDEILDGMKPPAENNLWHFRAALPILSIPGVANTNHPPAMRMITNGIAMVGAKLPMILDVGWATNTWAELEEDLKAKAEGIQHLHALIENPTMDFGLDYHQGFSIRITGLSELKQAVQVLFSATILELYNGDAAAASEHIRASLALCQGTADERLLISQLVRIAITQITIASVWELLQSPAMADADLELIQSDLRSIQFLRPMELAIEMERAMGGLNVEQMRSSGETYGRITGQGGSLPTGGLSVGNAVAWAKRLFSPDQIRKNAGEVVWRTTLSFADEKQHLEGLQLVLEAARAIATNGACAAELDKLDARLEAIGIVESEDDDADFFGSTLSLAAVREMVANAALSVNRCLYRVMKMEISRALAITAIALKRHQLRYGVYPSELKSLVPSFLNEVPRDPVDGQPLRYRLLENGDFLLYSVGEDGKDDGGDPTSRKSGSFHLQNGRDWVWPQSASEEEVAAYVERSR